jgi:hypothetical protein
MIEQIEANKNNIILDKIVAHLEKNLIDKENSYIEPYEQLAIITPSDCSQILDPNYKTNDKINQFIGNFNKKFILDQEIVLNIDNGKINIYDYINCEKALYLSKCEIIKDSIFNHPNKLLKLLDEIKSN